MRLIPKSSKFRFALGAILVSALLGAGVASAAVASAHGDRHGNKATPAERLARIEQELADGSIDEDRAAEMRERVAAHQERHEARQAARQELADLLGMTTDEMHDARHGGSTLADMATAAGVDVSEITDLLTTHAEARIAAALADGKITEDEAAEKRDALAEHIQAKVDGEHVDGDGFGRRGHGKHGHGKHGHGKHGHTDSDTGDA